MKSQTRLALVALGAFVLTVAGCGVTPSRTQTKAQDQAATTPAKATAKAARRDPCAVITKEEIEAALGAAVSEVVSDGNDCNYRPTEGSLKSAQVSVDDEEAAAAMQGAKAGIKMMGLGQAVPDIGDEAVFMAPGVLYVRKGDVLVKVSLFYVDNPLDKTKALAAKALARL